MNTKITELVTVLLDFVGPLYDDDTDQEDNQ